MSTMKTPSSTVLSQITLLSTMPISELKSMWQQLYNAHPPINGRAYIERRIAYQLQVNALSDKEKKIVSNNTKRIEKIALMHKSTKKGASCIPIQGTILRRIYNDVEYEVIVTSDGQFEFQKRVYKSLSKIAKEITGTHWSGPLFFGLRQSKKSSTKSKGRK